MGKEAAQGESRAAKRARPDRSEPIQVHINGRNSLDILNARDISETGLGVYVPHRFVGCDIDSGVELVVTLPGRKAFVAGGTIRHRTELGELTPFFGVEFTDISEKHLQLIRSYIWEQTKSEPSSA